YDIEGERPQEAVRREVREETGCLPTAVESLGRILSSPGFTDEAIDLFLVRAERAGEPESGIEIVEMTLEEAVRMVRDGRIDDAKSAVALLLAAGMLNPARHLPDREEGL
ncbi:MAG TPA: NUDIX hydrolase, partial [Actinomycetota bacterium]